jgi:hypothetical protein
VLVAVAVTVALPVKLAPLAGLVRQTVTLYEPEDGLLVVQVPVVLWISDAWWRLVPGAGLAAVERIELMPVLLVQSSTSVIATTEDTYLLSRRPPLNRDLKRRILHTFTSLHPASGG